MLNILAIIAPIYILILIGFATTRAGLFAKADMRVFGKFVINLALPALLLRALSQRQVGEILNVSYLLAYCIGSWAVIGLGYAWCRRVSRLNPATSAFYAMGMSCANSGFIGYPILLLTLAPVAGVSLALNMVVENLLVIPFLLFMAERKPGSAGRWQTLGKALARLICNPLILGLLAGLTVSVLGLTLPAPVTRTVDTLTGRLNLLLAWQTHVSPGFPGCGCYMRLLHFCLGGSMAHPYLTTRKTTRQLYFRRAVPSDLRAILPREIWISLATPCRRTALTRLARAAVWFEETLEQARRQLGGELTGSWTPRQEGGLRQPRRAAPLLHPWPDAERWLDANLAAWEARLDAMATQVAPAPPRLPPAGLEDTWATVLASWHQLRAPADRTFAAAASEVARFINLTGDKPVTHITFANVEHYKRHCQEELELSLATINKNLSMLSGILGSAIRAHLGNLTSNPFAGGKYSKKAVTKGRAHRRDAYSPEELNLLLHSPVFTTGLRPQAGAAEAAYWLPLLGLMTGARLEDLCSLRPCDIVQREGVWCAHLHDAKREKRLGRLDIKRHVPLHVALLSMGFLSYVQQQRTLGPSHRLFPALCADRWGLYGKSFGSWYNRYLDARGLDDPRLTFHSFRHTFRAACEESGISGDVAEALMGRAPDADYGRNENGEKRLSIPILAAAISKLRFDGVQMAHLYVSPAPMPGLN